MGRVRLTVALLAAAATLLSPPLAGAAPHFKRCGAFMFSCARVSVPLDRGGVTPGRVSLFVKRIAAQRPPRQGALFVLAGGPGQSATVAFDGDALGVLSPAFRHSDLIVFDQRGTGRSGLLRCRALERSNLFDAGRAAGICARHLGARRYHYTSRDSVEDVESLRVALGLDKIAIYGTSYGVKVALGYALTYPEHVERLALDSVLEVDGPDPFYRPTLEALPRVLHSLCRSTCRSFTADPLGDLARLVRRMGAHGLRGRVVDPRGRLRPARLSRGELFLMLISGDFDPALRAAFPGAVRAALNGDRVPLLRMGRRSFSIEGEPPPPRLISTALFTATTCEEMLHALAAHRTSRPGRATPAGRGGGGAAARPGVPALRPRQPARERPAPAVRPLARLACGADVRAWPTAGRPGAAARGGGRPAHARRGRPAGRRPVPAGQAGGGARHRPFGAGQRRIRLHGARLRAVLPRSARLDHLPARPRASSRPRRRRQRRCARSRRRRALAASAAGR